MRKVLFLLLALVVIGLAGCQKPATSTASTKSGPAWPGKMFLVTDPAQPVSEQPTTFRVTLTNAAGQPVTGGKVEASLKMQSMDMGKNVVQLTEKGDGLYEGKGQFSMAGPWNVVVTASAAGTSGEQTFDVVAKR